MKGEFELLPALARRMRGIAATIILPAVGLLAGCDEGTPRPVPPPATQAATHPSDQVEPIDFAALRPEDPTPVRPDYVVGRVVGSDGKPLHMPGLRIEVVVTAILDSTGSKSQVHIEAAKDGTYMKKLEPGTCLAVTGRIEFPFQERTYRLPLVPVGHPISRQESSLGVVQDFRWELTGLRPGADKENMVPETWLGGSLYARYYGLLAEDQTVRPAPSGTRVVFTITPTTTLANGTTGKPITIERKYDAAGATLGQPLLPDIPLSVIEIKGVEILPDGTQRSLLLRQEDNTWGNSLTGVFSADIEHSLLKAMEFTFTRKEN